MDSAVSSRGQQCAIKGVNHANNGQWNPNDPPMAINSMAVFKEVKKAYEHKLEVINKVGGAKKLELTLETLRSWVADVNGQNELLVKAIEDLETEATARILLERSVHQERVGELRVEVCALRRRLARKDSDLRGLVEVLRRLREFDYCTLDGIHFFEVTESDIFGAVDWRQKKIGGSMGDTNKKRQIWKQTKEDTKNHRK